MYFYCLDRIIFIQQSMEMSEKKLKDHRGVYVIFHKIAL